MFALPAPPVFRTGHSTLRFASIMADWETSSGSSLPFLTASADRPSSNNRSSAALIRRWLSFRMRSFCWADDGGCRRLGRCFHGKWGRDCARPAVLEQAGKWPPVWCDTTLPHASLGCCELGRLAGWWRCHGDTIRHLRNHSSWNRSIHMLMFWECGQKMSFNCNKV